ncbi:MAG: hypothetical protein GXO86_02615 [Chlorobi bacterium]|nr:hypothetical protein [Chlorobiota bacterium]
MPETDFAFSEWYHFALLLLWLAVLFGGLFFFNKIEKLFRLKDDFSDGSKIAVGLLLTSFIFGFVVFLVLTFSAETAHSKTAIILFYGLAFLLLLLNAFTCFRNYLLQSAIIRFLLLSALMLVYFYSGLLGGLLVIALFALAVIVFALLKTKKILTIK